MLKSSWGVILLLFLSLNPKVCAQYDFLNHCENINVLNSSERESIHTLFKHYKVNTCESLEQKLEQTGYLKLSGLGLKSATFLKFFHHFIKIDLSDNRLNKLPPIKMSNLSHLWLSENELDDISVLKFIDSLELLSVSDNYIKIIPEINCEKLLALDLSRNKISSIKNLAHCRKLKFLFLKYNKIEDLSPIAYHHGSIKIKNWSKLDEFRKNEDIDHLLGYIYTNKGIMLSNERFYAQALNYYNKSTM